MWQERAAMLDLAALDGPVRAALPIGRPRQSDSKIIRKPHFDCGHGVASDTAIDPTARQSRAPIITINTF